MKKQFNLILVALLNYFPSLTRDVMPLTNFEAFFYLFTRIFYLLKIQAKYAHQLKRFHPPVMVGFDSEFHKLSSYEISPTRLRRKARSIQQSSFALTFATLHHSNCNFYLERLRVIFRRDLTSVKQTFPSNPYGSCFMRMERNSNELNNSAWMKIWNLALPLDGMNFTSLKMQRVPRPGAFRAILHIHF